MNLREAIEKALYHYNSRKSFTSGAIEGRDKVGLIALLEASLQEAVSEVVTEEVELELETVERENDYLYALVKYIINRSGRALTVSFDELHKADRWYLVIDKVNNDEDLRLKVEREWEDGST